MNKKVKIALWCLFAIVSIAVLVLYIVFPGQTTYYFNCVKDFINKPLPIVGISLSVIMIFVYKVVVSTRFGQKKLAEYKEKLDLLHNEYNEFKAHMDEKTIETKEYIEELKEIIRNTQEQLNKACELSKNVKIKGLVNYEETVDSDTEEK